ncbi:MULTISPECIES: Na+/H+ antiporter NhaA [unclassified Brevibacterium]|uniref:Na+/H+ antiporter NhaA n=1 Tax=unclassified Brevibacterium TaxID=2614124 RepID=UPI001E29BFB3|nr:MULTISPECIES: Na+/H+ antiporter NhaA [unclassified Brevibacterium]MDK8434859.1 Na+/H+ antiporter NhaA [Brevibacterium sp. H-BE7]
MDTVGGALLLAATVAALIWANSPASSSYFSIRDFELGFEPWHLKLSLGQWAADGLLAIFFFLVGLELKVEFTKGSLRSFSTAIVPISAAAGGVLIPAVIYAGLLVASPELLGGWAIPTATDIAFAVAVLALAGSHLPGALRVFLLTLAAVDDLLAITIIAVFYTEEISLLALAAALAAALVFGALTWRFTDFFRRHGWAAWLILLPLGVVAWGFMHASGVHATIAGVILGFAVPVLARKPRRAVPLASDGGNSGIAAEATPGLAEILEHRLRPLSSGFAVPVFAFFAAGVAVGGRSGLIEAFSQPLTFAIIAALVLGKPLGILSSTWLISKFTRASLDPSLKWIDLMGIGLLAGIGFTVSLLVAELSFASGSAEHDHAKVAILTASLLAAVLATLVLTIRNRHYRRQSLKREAHR